MIVEARRMEDGGEKPFVSLFDFARRCDLKRIGKRSLEMLARAGAFDELDRNRRRVFESLDALSAYSAAIHEQKGSNQVSLFGEAGDDLPEPRLPNPADWLPNERLAHEHMAIGFYLSGHPLDDYMPSLKRRGCLTLAEVEDRVQGGAFAAKLAGAVSSRQERKSQRGNRFAFVQLSDPSGLFEVVMFSDVLEASRDHLETGANVVLTVEATFESDQLKLLARGVQPIDSVVADAGGSGLRIFVEDQEAITTVAGLLERAKSEAKLKGRGPVHLCLMHPDLPGEVDVLLGEDFPVNPQIKGALKSLGGVMTVEEV